MKNTVTIDIYKKRGQSDIIIVFVSGYAINKSDCRINVANFIAREIGQDEIPVVTYGNDLPVESSIEVY